MIFYLTFRLISCFTAFLYPAYASYKTLSQRPASEEDLERWLMYWSVLGCVVGMEYAAEWLISWVPFYYPIKTTFLLYLALPQTQGSSYLYSKHLQPFFHEHESEIDATLASLKTRVYVFVQEQVRNLWGHVASSMGPQPPDFVGAGRAPDVNSSAPPSLGDPLSGPTQLVTSFWRSYGTAIIASGAAMLRQSTAAAGSSNQALNSPPLDTPSGFGAPLPGTDSRAREDRRRRLQAELEALEGASAMSTPNMAPYDVSSPPPPPPFPIPVIPRASASYHPSPSRESSSSDLRERSGAGTSGRFEEVEIPSDAEGEGYVYGPGGRPPAQKRTSWFFGWGGEGAPQGAYERVKTD
ncbi:hypothetical protein JAAARDRAFT_36300 [Jaapia argillacea MUCL 33604]|uniref:Protein YOP1 n=1 Tax=Jaapia argillacea MUCL 33604 TaxID=933084 RepID=A0A067PPU2_9AGAM|nr:hypothetical protein JAAARDRAFT_36300 [Jaapia argillacea MUCL 33604]